MGIANHKPTLLGILLGSGILLFGCVTNPQPFPLPIAPDASAIFVSNPEQAERAVTTGVPGAVPAAQPGSEIVLSTSPSGEEARGPVFADGSFSLWLRLKASDKLEARVELAGQSSDRVQVAFRVETPNDGNLVVRTVSAVLEGKATVSGGYRAGQRVLIGNLRSGAATVTITDASNDFSATLAAAPGDKLSVFGLDPTTKGTSVAVEAAVPGP